MPEDTPVLDALAAITAVSIAGSELPAREHVIARLAALIAVDAPASSYLLNAGSAIEVGITVQDVQSLLVAVAPVVGTPRVMAAAGNITRALGLAVALADAELDDLDDA
ncbi:MAG TPA: carboxymuconolactone decarboxylase family protein [Nakamurella sp.]